MGILENFSRRKIVKRVATPYGWQWNDPKGPSAPSEEQLAKQTGKKNIAEFLQKEYGYRIGAVAHGTTFDAYHDIKQVGGLKAKPEWGKGRTGIFCWTDVESAMNWAYFWYGTEAMVITIKPSFITEAYWDRDEGNSQWAFSPHSKSLIIKNDIPMEGFEGDFLHSEDEDSEWQENLDNMRGEEAYSSLMNWRQISEYHGDDGYEGDVGWAKRDDVIESEQEEASEETA